MDACREGSALMERLEMLIEKEEEEEDKEYINRFQDNI